MFSSGYRRRVSNQYPVTGPEKHVIWESDFGPSFVLAPNVLEVASYGFTQMVTNAIDHSAGQSVFVWMNQDESNVSIVVPDNGTGIFQRITTSLKLPDTRQALFGLSKGRLTTDPSKRTGEGVFFTSRMFDTFQIEANGPTFNHRDSSAHDRLREEKGICAKEAAPWMEIAINSARNTADVYA